jgi:hypothetical protein
VRGAGRVIVWAHGFVIALLVSVFIRAERR